MLNSYNKHMNYSIVILGAPYSTQSATTALNFTKALLRNGHKVYRVFFYHDAVHSGSELSTPPQDELNIPEKWQELKNKHNIDLVICIAAAVKRGVLDATEARRHEKKGANLSDCFELSGLGQLVDATEHSDRLITFGP